MFFKYTVSKETDLEKLLLLLNVTNKSGIQVYINKQEYPTPEKDMHLYAFGDVPNQIIQQFPSMHLMNKAL